MQVILYFDFCAVILVAVLLHSIFTRKMTKGLTNRLFIGLLVICAVSAVCDIWSEAYGVWLPVGDKVSPIRYILTYLYFISHTLSALVYVLYLISLTDTWHKVEKQVWLKIAILLPYVVVLVTLFSNLFTGKVFYFNEQLIYARGEHIIVLYICAGIDMAIGACYLIAYRKLFSKDRFWALFSLFPFELIAVIIQFFYHEILIEIFFTVVAHLMVMIVIQRPEENVDPIFGVGNYYAYTNDLKRGFATKKNIGVVIIKFLNYMSMTSLLGYDSYNELLKRVSDSIIPLAKKNGSYTNLYYIDRGRFALILGNHDREKIDKFTAQIEQLFNDSSLFDSTTIALQPCICQLYCPEEIADFNSLISFGENFYKMDEIPKGIIHISDFDSRNFELHNEIDTVIANAISEHKFEMYYQPIYSTVQKKFISAEALIRLKDEKYGFIPPDLFITAAEKNGAIHQIGDFVFDSVCSFIESDEFKDLGLEYIEVNVSTAQYMQAQLAERILQILESHNVSPDKINLEITETAFNASQKTLMENIGRLSKAGLTFSLDDYGTGYSNIQRLVSMPFKIVKIDKSFVDESHNNRMWNVIENTVKMFKDLNMEIVVEGVETEENVIQFTDLGCDFIQGYYYSRPLPKDKFIEFISCPRYTCT